MSAIVQLASTLSLLFNFILPQNVATYMQALFFFTSFRVSLSSPFYSLFYILIHGRGGRKGTLSHFLLTIHTFLSSALFLLPFSPISPQSFPPPSSSSLLLLHDGLPALRDAVIGRLLFPFLRYDWGQKLQQTSISRHQRKQGWCVSPRGAATQMRTVPFVASKLAIYLDSAAEAIMSFQKTECGSQLHCGTILIT